MKEMRQGNPAVRMDGVWQTIAIERKLEYTFRYDWHWKSAVAMGRILEIGNPAGLARVKPVAKGYIPGKSNRY